MHMHFDQVDNLYLQLAGTKRFRIFPPGQTGALYPYPWHHPLDRSAQVDVRTAALGGDGARRELERFPRLAGARGSEVTLRPGELLFLPAYWWHEVLTDGVPSGELTVSVNFWFDTSAKLMGLPSLPLSPMRLVEAARQLEMIVADSLGDRSELVPCFLRGLRRQLERAARPSHTGKATRTACGSWALLHKERPPTVPAAQWERLFEYLAAKLLLLFPVPADALAFVRDYLDDARFERLALRK